MMSTYRILMFGDKCEEAVHKTLDSILTEEISCITRSELENVDLDDLLSDFLPHIVFVTSRSRIEVLKFIKGQDRWIHIPIFVMSYSLSVEEISTLPHHFPLFKPINVHHLLVYVKYVLEHTQD